MRKRAIILNTAIIFGFVAVFLRLVDLMVLNHGRFSERARIQQLKQEDIQVGADSYLTEGEGSLA